MANSKYNWDEIISDCAELVANSIAKNKDVPKNFPTLYKLLQAKYSPKGNNQSKNNLPTENTFRQIMHQKLEVGKNQRNIRATLYKLAGRYDKMTLQQLTENVKITSESSATQSSWLFLRIDDSQYTNTNNISHLYLLSHKLKDKFSKKILFISSDTDTIVLLCADRKARAEILDYFKKCAVCDRITIEIGGKNGNENNV